jgi:hypothetical protein
MLLRRVAVIAMSFALPQCSTVESPVGTPCTPVREHNPAFGGFRISEQTYETDVPECGTGVCLINHFQGRTSCPLGQLAPTDASGNLGCVPDFDGQGRYVEAQGSCSTGQTCARAGSVSPLCVPQQGDAADQFCLDAGAGSKCNQDGFCECDSNADCLNQTGVVVSCEVDSHQCIAYACQSNLGCQQAGASPQDNQGKACCQPDTEQPLTRSVCGECKGTDGNAPRDAENAVYCTCRCGPVDGEPEDPDADFCACPDGFECSEIRSNLGLDDEPPGKFCIRTGTAYDPADAQCGAVDGFWTASKDLTCAGLSSGQCQSSGGPCNPH